MNLARWFAVAASSAAVLLSSGFLGASPALLWVALWALSGVALIGSVDAGGVSRKPLSIAGGLLLVSALVVPWPLALGPAALGLGLLAMVGGRGLAAIGGGVFGAGVLWLLGSFVMFGYESMVARVATLPAPLSEAIVWLLGWAQVDGAVDGERIVLFSMRAKHPVAATWSLFADAGSVLFLANGGVLVAAMGGRRLRTLGWLFLAWVGWLFLRVSAVLAIYLNLVLRTKYDEPLEHASLFWSEWLQLGLLVPLLLIAWRIGGALRPYVVTASTAAGWRPVALGALGAIVAWCGAAVVLYKPSGVRKPGRVVIDEYHCKVDDWTRVRWPQKEFDTTSTLRAYDTEWYGEAAAYNYASIYEYSSRFYSMARNDRPITRATLSECDVLVLKVPSRYYSDDEIAAVRDFVKRGGGLLLIGEHTTVFGSSVPLNQIARTYGFEFRYDCLFGMDSVYEQDYTPVVARHPVLQQMEHMSFAVSCSIDPGSSSGCAVMRAGGLKSLGSNYFASNFYPQPDDDPRMLHGSFVQLWSTGDGEGRVLAFTDSTIFANFSCYDPGKSELFLGMLEWLNHKEGGSVWWLGLLGVLALMGFVYLGRGGGVSLPIFVGGPVAGWCLGLMVVPLLHRLPVPVVPADRPVFDVAIERSICSDVKLPNGGFLDGKWFSYGLFERTIQRLTKPHQGTKAGVTWRTERTDFAAALESDLIVFFRPTETLGADQLARLHEYVSSGGRVLVLDAPEHKDDSYVWTTATTNALLAPFGLGVDHDRVLKGPVLSVGALPKITALGAHPVTGGSPFASVDGVPVATSRRVGKGIVMVLGCGARFSDLGMGVTDKIAPTPEIREVYEYEYALLRALDARRNPAAAK